MKKSIFLFFAAILCAMSAGAAVTFTEEAVIYFTMENDNDGNNWWNNSGCYHYATFKGASGTTNATVHLYNISSRSNSASAQTNPVFFATIPAGTYSKISFYRGKTATTLSSYHNAATDKVDLQADKNKFGTIYNENFGSWQSWSKTQETSTVALSASSNNVNENDVVTLTPSLTTNADLNKIKSVSYSITPNSGASIDGNEFKATAVGTYTVTATITYNAKGFVDITQTTTATTTISVKSAAEETHDVTVSYIFGETKLQDPTTVNTVGVETPVKVTAPEIAKYTFVNWTLGADVATTDALTSNEINITTEAGGSDFTLVANYEKAKLTYTVTVPAGTENCYLVGAMNGWNVENPIEMTKQGENVFTTTLEGVATTDEYKYLSQKGTWDYADIQEANRTWTANDVVTAWKDPLATNVHLAGTMTDWDNNKIEFKKATKGATTASIILNLTAGEYKFKIVDNGSWLGNDATIDKTISGWTFAGDKGDCPFKATIAGDYTFTWAISTKKLSVTYPTICAITATANDAAMGTIAGAGNYGKGSTATLTATPNDGYLFVNWTKGGVEVATTQEYSFKVEDAVELVANFEAAPEEVHNVTVSYVCGGNKIAEDQTVAAVGETTPKTAEAPEIWGYTFSSWTLGAGVTSTDATANPISINIVAGGSDYTLTANYTEIPKVTVYFVNNKKWSKVNAYGWKEGEEQGTPGWPGKDITASKETEQVADFDVYSYNVVPGSYDNIIFNNGSGTQTETFKWTDGKYYYVDATKNYVGGTKEEVEKALVDVYTMMGAGELGLSWDLTTTGNDMTKQANGTYTLVKEGLDLAATGSYEYKVVKNHSWDWSIPSGTENQTLKVDKDGTYTVTFTLSADKKTLTAGAECTAEKEVILDCSVAGTINLVGGTSDFTDKLAMTYDEVSKTYSKTFTALAAGNYQMKVVYGSDWLGYDELTKPVPANVTEGDDKKIKFSLAGAGDVTVTYNVEKGIGLTGNFAVPNPPVISYVLMGVDGDWTTGIPMTQNPDNADEYMLLGQTISAIDAVKVVKLVDGEKSAFCGKTQVEDGSADCTGDENDNIVLTAGIYDFYYKVTANEVYINASIAVTIRKDLTPGQWGTLCPTQNVKNPTGATFYQIAYLEEKDGLPFNMHFYEVEGNLEAGQPYFFIASATEIKGVKFGDVKTEGDNANGFYGYIGAEAWTLPYQESFDATSDENTFVIWNNSVFRINAETKIKSERCYININSTEPSRTSTPALVGARRITMGVSGINGQNTATGVENVDASAQPVKTIINGQLFILRGEKMYDAQGKLVK